MQKKHYLITGTAGFIGFHLAYRLLREGHSVTGFDGMTPYYNLSLKERRHAMLGKFGRFTPVIGMLEDKVALGTVLGHGRPDVIVHLAAQAGVRYSLENPRAYVDSNLVGTWQILELAKEHRPEHLLIASSSSIYGANEKVPFAEMDRTDEPLTLYAASKKASELMAHSYAHLHKVPTTAFRFFTVYGPWGRPDMALFKFVDNVLKGKPIDIYGEGRMSRDFTYVDDLVESIVRLAAVIPGESNRVQDLDTLSRHAPYRVINIGGGQPIPLMEFVEAVERAVGHPALRNMLPMQQGDVPRTYAATNLLKALIGFCPSVPVSQGVPKFVEWYRTYLADQQSQ